MLRTELVGRIAVFDPFECDRVLGIKEFSNTTKGKIVYVNTKNEWFSVKYGNLRTSFKFSDIGKTVKIL